ncbi:MAG: TRAP transporter small permease [Minwuia sp.]|uniref:TRAP transporter small permease n=1 Tax=Minwuia sp. TaxID=2493630 RepID=UPI003A8466AE
MNAVVLIYRILRRINDVIAAVAMALGMAIVAFAAISLFAAAIERHVSGRGYAWMNDLPPFLLPWCVFPLMGVLYRSGRHISVEVAPSLLGGHRRHALEFAISVIVFSSAVYFCHAGIDATGFFRMLGEVTETEIRLPFWALYAAFPTGFAILALFALEAMLRSALAMGGRPMDEAAVEANS